MQHVPPSRWPIAIGLYLGSGLLLGIAQLPRLFGNFGLKPGIGNALAVNILLPLVVVLITAWYPRKRTAVVGAALTYAGFVVGARLVIECRFWLWPKTFLTSVSPFVVVGSIVCAVLAYAAVRVFVPWRRVGYPERDSGPRCGCGYSVHGVAGPICPECGTPITGTKPVKTGPGITEGREPT